MAKIPYTSNGLFAQTSCPFWKKSELGSVIKVHSHYCTRRCKHYRSTNYREKYVVCLADCSSRLEEILGKIDIVIANNKCDDIVFEEFLAEIREGIAEVLDGTNNNQ